MRMILILAAFVLLTSLLAMAIGARLIDPSGGGRAGIKVDYPVPDLKLSALNFSHDQIEVTDFTGDDLKENEKVILLNVFASWCPPCNYEHPVLMRLAERLDGTDIELWGLNYRDREADARAYLRNRGTPYTRLAADRQGLAGVRLGLTGTPETLLITPDGRIRYRYAGALYWGLIEDVILPYAAELQAETEQAERGR